MIGLYIKWDYKKKGGKEKMTKVSGSFTGKVNFQTTVSLPHLANYKLNLTEVTGLQKSTDDKWNDASITYWGMADLVKGSGSQRGYFLNIHADGYQDWGTFDGKITTSGKQITLKGKWKFTGGTGKFRRIKGGGNYKGRMDSPAGVKIEWDGRYQI